MKHVLIACVVFALCLAVGLFSLFTCARPARRRTSCSSAPSVRRRRRTIPARPRPCGRRRRSGRGASGSSGSFCTTREVDEVIALFAQLEQFIRLEDLDDYLAACHELTARLEHIRRMELPTVENVM